MTNKDNATAKIALANTATKSREKTNENFLINGSFSVIRSTKEPKNAAIKSRRTLSRNGDGLIKSF